MEIILFSALRYFSGPCDLVEVVLTFVRYNLVQVAILTHLPLHSSSALVFQDQEMLFDCRNTFFAVEWDPFHSHEVLFGAEQMCE